MPAVADLAVENGIGQLRPRLPEANRFAQNRRSYKCSYDNGMLCGSASPLI
jgi:hypothetical protein